MTSDLKNWKEESNLLTAMERREFDREATEEGVEEYDWKVLTPMRGSAHILREIRKARIGVERANMKLKILRELERSL
ncbi:MAG: hypothetical protein ACTHN7_00365 [Solirubrobacterales bacterium]